MSDFCFHGNSIMSPWQQAFFTFCLHGNGILSPWQQAYAACCIHGNNLLSPWQPDFSTSAFMGMGLCSSFIHGNQRLPHFISILTTVCLNGNQCLQLLPSWQLDFETFCLLSNYILSPRQPAVAAFCFSGNIILFLSSSILSPRQPAFTACCIPGNDIRSPWQPIT